MAFMFESVWPLCYLAGGSKWGWDEVKAVLNPSLYSRLQYSQVQSGQLKGLKSIPLLCGVDSVVVCMLFSLFNKVSGTREAQSNMAQRGAPQRFSRAGTRLEAHYEFVAGGLEHERGISTFESRFCSGLACWSVF